MLRYCYFVGSFYCSMQLYYSYSTVIGILDFVLATCIGKVAARRAYSVKNTLGCMVGPTLAVICVAAAGLLVVTQ